VGLLKSAVTSAIKVSRAVRANREDALKLGDLILSTAADVMETLTIHLPKDVRLGDCVPKLATAIDEAVKVMDVFCGQQFFSAAWSHMRNARELQGGADAILTAFRDLQSAVGRAALKYCVRNDEEQQRSKEHVKQLEARTKKRLKELEQRFQAREHEAEIREQRTFNQALKLSKLVEIKRDLIMSADKGTLELLMEASGSTGDALSRGMVEVGELSHVLQTVRRVEEDARAAERRRQEDKKRLGVIEMKLALVEQQTREQQAREELRTWMTGKGLSQSILTDAVVDLSGKGLGYGMVCRVVILVLMYLYGRHRSQSAKEDIAHPYPAITRREPSPSRPGPRRG
jgi:hypothetical protein